ncbi:Adenosine receptor A2a [Cyphomyrmex costatus]|uniref:Adenosine receptor A2a n=2 Tax=Cyphomyrmex costatus TaxID=456900 RepID=A0A195CAT9_9HYME|nr:Adenosine receptor A2a [Cyphomyrmex costatus]
MNLTVSNLLTCAVLNPLLMMDGPTVEDTLMTSTSTPDDFTSPFGSTSTSASAASNICAISEGATAFVTTSSVLSVLLIAIDQYFAVVDPLRYRARVDKLKSAVLIVSIWLVSMIFGLIAALNPSPRSLWLSCSTTTLLNNSSYREFASNVTATAETSIESAFAFFSNGTSEDEEEEVIDDVTPTLLKTIESIKIDSSIGLLENSTVIFRTMTNDSVTYGLIYAVVHSVFAYLLPFAGVCWIYISIYSAAHRNSERTRRTGSRPILSSGSFSEDPYYYVKAQHQSVETFPEDFRRIPKISSLSSIDETSETTHSVNQISRRRSYSSSLDAAQTGSNDEQTSSGIVFTVGLQPVEMSSPCDQNNDNNLTEATDLQTNYLKKERVLSYENLVASQFHDSEADRRRKSSCDLTDEIGESSGWIAGADSSDSENDDRRYGYFDSLKVPKTTRKITDRRSSDCRLLSVTECERTEEQCDDVEDLEQDSFKTTTCIEEKVSVTVKPMEREQAQNEVPNSSSNSENKRSRRPSRRLSRPSIFDANVESYAISRNAENIGYNSSEPSSCFLPPIVTITPAPGKSNSLHRVASVRSTNSYINSLKHRISNGSLFRYREETRAARISALVIVMGLICWSPYVLLNMIKNLPQYSDYAFPHEYDVLALSFLILAAYVSPLLFGYRSRRVKRELRKFFCFHRELSYKNNRSLMAKKVLKRRHSNTLSHLEMDHRYNIFNCVYGRSRWPKEKVQFVQVPDTALAVETCRSSFSSGASTQISSTSTEEC